MSTLAFVAEKGGVGKSTIAANVAGTLARRGSRVLVVDCDPQGSLTYSLGVRNAALSLADAIDNPGQPIEDTVVTGLPCRVDVIPADRQLQPVERKLDRAYEDAAAGDQASREYLERVERQLLGLRAGYDHVLFDTQASMGTLAILAIGASDGVIGVTLPEVLAGRSAAGLSRFVENLRADGQTKAAFLGLLVNRYDRRSVAAGQIIEILHAAGAPVFTHAIGQRTRITEAPATGMPLTVSNPRSEFSRMFDDVTDEILTRMAGV